MSEPESDILTELAAEVVRLTIRLSSSFREAALLSDDLELAALACDQEAEGRALLEKWGCDE